MDELNKRKVKLKTQEAERAEKLRKELSKNLANKKKKIDLEKELSVDNTEMNTLQKEINQLKESISAQEQKLSKLNPNVTLDLGPNDDFLYLLYSDKIIFTDEQFNLYTYHLYPFREIIQRSILSKDESHLLGKWIRWKNQYNEMLYDKGEVCWNGPPRSTRVKLTCGTEEKIEHISEPGKCEYEISLITSSACLEKELDTMKKKREDLLNIVNQSKDTV